MDNLVAAILRGEPTAWPADAGHVEQDRFFAAASRHGVLPLLAPHLHQAKTLEGWPASIRERLVEAARNEVMVESLRRREVRRLHVALAAANVRPLLMKGTALAYLCYPHRLRPRGDTDLLVRRTDVTRATRALHTLGYRRALQTPGELVMPQMEFVKDERPGIRHVCDLHVKIANPQLFAETLSYDELSTRAVDVPELGAGARALGPVDALLLACIHRVAHHNDCEKLLWIYDIHLLANGMDRATLGHVAVRAAEKRITAVCRRGLSLAHRWFHTEVPHDVMRALALVDAAEPSAAYLGAGSGRWTSCGPISTRWVAGATGGSSCASTSFPPVATCASGTECRARCSCPRSTCTAAPGAPARGCGDHRIARPEGGERERLALAGCQTDIFSCAT